MSMSPAARRAIAASWIRLFDEDDGVQPATGAIRGHFLYRRGLDHNFFNDGFGNDARYFNLNGRTFFGYDLRLGNDAGDLHLLYDRFATAGDNRKGEEEKGHSGQEFFRHLIFSHKDDIGQVISNLLQHYGDFRPVIISIPTYLPMTGCLIC